MPPGKVAVVGDVVLGPEDMAGIKAQLGAYAQLRFSGAEGQAALVGAVVTAELLAQEAIAAGLGDDPRVRWALIEEVASLYEAAELERRVPRAEVAADTDALRRYYDAHPEQFTIPERRNLSGVVISSIAEADDALARLRAGTTDLASLGEVVSTPLQSRDDVAHPGFHAFLFAEGKQVGDWLDAPVLVGGFMIVGKIDQIVPASREPFDDPKVQERLVAAVRAPRAEEARRALLSELAKRFEAQAPHAR